MSASPTSFDVVCSGDDIYITNLHIAVLASTDEVGVVHGFTLTIDGAVVLSLGKEEWEELSTALTILSGERLRKTVFYIREQESK